MTSGRIHLKGITWNHSRGLLPMVATAQRFHETRPEVTVDWQVRSLQEFADAPIQRLAETFDLLVIDHPFVGYAAAHGTLLPLDEFLTPQFLDDQAAGSVGGSHPSYNYGGRQWALAIDAATPVASWRPDLLPTLPGTWEEVLALARAGRVAVPAVPVDCLMYFYMMCLAEGEEPFATEGLVVSDRVGEAALERLRGLLSLCDPVCFTRNPIATYEAMAAGDTLAYCPFGYGYSNYAREGYAAHRLRFGDLPAGLRSTLGGTGLAVSSRSAHKEAAIAYARYVADAGTQRRLYTQSGGQPGHRAAWTDEEANRQTAGYFRDTLPALDRAYVRPRYDGYLHFQDEAGPVVHAALRGAITATSALSEMQKLHAGSRR